MYTLLIFEILIWIYYALHAPPVAARVFELVKDKYFLLGADSYFLELFVKHHHLNSTISSDINLFGINMDAELVKKRISKIIEYYKHIITNNLISILDIP